jgi:prevent-host-death family protein
MRTIQASKARTHLYSILDEIERGETIIITRNGKPIARFIPEPNREVKIDPERARQAMENIRELRERNGKVSLEEILSARDEGRR